MGNGEFFPAELDIVKDEDVEVDRSRFVLGGRQASHSHFYGFQKTKKFPGVHVCPETAYEIEKPRLSFIAHRACLIERRHLFDGSPALNILQGLEHIALSVPEIRSQQEVDRMNRPVIYRHGTFSPFGR
jgi:hypothetical protein